MRKWTLFLSLSLILVLGLAACGGDGGTAGGGDVSAGKTVFEQTAAPACTTCHSLEAGVTLVGPSLATIGADAGSMVPGQSAEEYLRESVVSPNAHVVEGFGSNLMPQDYGTQLSEQQIDDLVAYMLSLK
ncbi:MAG: cytochrome c [Anaerolineae bacterium]|jgi:cytochrome c2